VRITATPEIILNNQVLCAARPSGIEQSPGRKTRARRIRATTVLERECGIITEIIHSQ